jgi:hypothetical protein
VQSASQNSGLPMNLRAWTKWPPAAVALCLQAAAFGAMLLIVSPLAGVAEFDLSVPWLVLGTGLLAAALSWRAGLAPWWWAMQLLFAPALALFLSLQLQPYWFLAAFLLLASVYWNSYRTQVPLYLSSRLVRQEVEKLLPAKAGFSFIDLGSGLGGMLAHLAAARPDGTFHGIEAAPLPFLLSWLRIKGRGRNNCSVAWGDLWSDNLADYDVVFAYLSPVPMPALWRKAREEMRPGTLFVSNTFVVTQAAAAQTIKLDDLHGSTLHVWRM